jgi:hypothetical protein
MLGDGLVRPYSLCNDPAELPTLGAAFCWLVALGSLPCWPWPRHWCGGARRSKGTMLNQQTDNALPSQDIFANDKALHELFATVQRENLLHWTQAQCNPGFQAVTKHAVVKDFLDYFAKSGG